MLKKENEYRYIPKFIIHLVLGFVILLLLNPLTIICYKCNKKYSALQTQEFVVKVLIKTFNLSDKL
jgi:hypothetical protein